MAQTTLGIPPTVYEAFKAFSTDHSQFALLLQISTGKLHTLAAIAFPSNPESTFQNALFQLESVINAHTPLFVIIRQNRSLSAITYIPYLADSKLKEQYLANRNLLVQSLGESLFSVSVICKDPGAILDARAWEERQSTYRFMDLHHGHDGDAEYDSCEKDEPQQTSVIDLGYKKTKCRLCDRRMKNKLEEDGLSALRNLNGGGDCVQLSVDPDNETIKLGFQDSPIMPSELASKISTAHPSFTFYRHPTSRVLYFVFFSPDSAPVKVRMMHTMAIPGLLNVTAKEQGVHVDQKIEIHDMDDLVFEERDQRIGKFRSVYLLNEQKGTESVWEGMPTS